MPVKKSAAKSQKRSPLTKKQALAAVKAVNEIFSKRREVPAAWKKGGKQWNRVLGHFGATGSQSRSK